MGVYLEEKYVPKSKFLVYRFFCSQTKVIIKFKGEVFAGDGLAGEDLASCEVGEGVLLCHRALHELAAAGAAGAVSALKFGHKARRFKLIQDGLVGISHQVLAVHANCDLGHSSKSPKSSMLTSLSICPTK